MKLTKRIKKSIKISGYGIYGTPISTITVRTITVRIPHPLRGSAR